MFDHDHDGVFIQMNIFNPDDIVQSELKILSWMFMTRKEIKKIVNVPYGIYAFTKPMKSLPSNDQWPHKIEETIYFGMAGKSESYVDFYHDRKSNGAINSYWSQSILHKRISTHIKHVNMKGSNQSKIYKLYHELYDVKNVDKIALCVMRPQKTIMNYEIRAWLKAMESNIIFAYTKQFEQIPVLNSEHKVNIGNKQRRENSYCQIRRRQIQDNLEDFFVDEAPRKRN